MRMFLQLLISKDFGGNPYEYDNCIHDFEAGSKTTSTFDMGLIKE